MKKSYSNHFQWSNLADAKARLNIHGLWRHFGFEGEPKANCRSPFRDDSRPSFSVKADGTLWNDFSTGDAGDSVDFFQRATGLPQKDACRKFIELAGGYFRTTPMAAQPRPEPAAAKPKPVFPDFTKGAAADIQHLATLRNTGREGLEWARERGLLWFTTLHGHPAWVVTDDARVNGQARRMDGRPWEHIGAKAWTLPGSWASWPIGIREAKDFPNLALVEGGPDLLAAFHFMVCEDRGRDCAPVAMLGASQRIHTDALPMFASKHVRIFGHDDDAGRGAVELWAAQLASVGADVDAFSFTALRQVDGNPVKDFNDLTSIHADDFEVENILRRMMP